MWGEFLCKIGFHKWVFYQHPVYYDGKWSESIKICTRRKCERMIID